MKAVSCTLWIPVLSLFLFCSFDIHAKPSSGNARNPSQKAGKPAKGQSAEEILKAAQSLYASTHYYACDVQIDVHYRNDLDRGSGDSQTIYRSARRDLSLEYSPPNYISTFWQRHNKSRSPLSRLPGEGGPPTKIGFLSTADDSYQLHLNLHRKNERSEPDTYAHIDTAIDHASESTRGFLPTIREFLNTSFHQDLLHNEIKSLKSVRYNRKNCIVLSVRGYTRKKIWIDEASYQIQRIEYVYDSKTIDGEIALLEWKRDGLFQDEETESTRINERIDLIRDWHAEYDKLVYRFKRQRFTHPD